MGEDGKIIYKVVLDDKNVENEAEAAGQKAGKGVERGASGGAGKFEQLMIGAARRIGEAFVNMAAKAVQGVEQIVQAGVEFNAKMEQYQVGLATLLGSEEEAARVMAQIRQDAARTPFDVDSLTQANQMLISTGMSAGDARKDVLNLANAIAATGGGSAELSRMAANMQQIQNVGKATAMDIRQFAMAGINIYGLLADSMGLTTEQVKDMDISYEQLSMALAHAAEAGGMYEGAMEAQSQTFNGRISTLKDNILQLEGSLTEDLFNHLSGTALPMIMDWVATLLEASQTGGIKGAIEAAKSILSNLIGQIEKAMPDMLNTGLSLVANLVNGVSNAIPKVLNAARSVVTEMLTALVNNAPQLIVAGLHFLTSLTKGVIENRDKLYQSAVTLISTLVKGLIEHTPEILMAAAELIFALASGIINGIPKALQAIFDLISNIVDSFKSIDWSTLGSNIVLGVWEGIKSLWGSLVEQFSNAVSNLWKSAKNALGISSPSKKFKYIGEMSVEGIEEGFKDGEEDLTRTVSTIYTGMLQAAGGDANVPSARDFENGVSYNLSATGGQYSVVVPLFLDGREIARATAWSMGQQLAWEEI